MSTHVSRDSSHPLQSAAYSAVLATFLIVFFSIGNQRGTPTHTLSVFPWLVSVLPFPLVLLPMLWQHWKGVSHVTRGTVVRHNERVVRWAAIFFSVFTTLFSYGHFNNPWLALYMGASTLITTWVIGVLVGSVGTLILEQVIIERNGL